MPPLERIAKLPKPIHLRTSTSLLWRLALVLPTRPFWLLKSLGSEDDFPVAMLTLYLRQRKDLKGKHGKLPKKNKTHLRDLNECHLHPKTSSTPSQKITKSRIGSTSEMWHNHGIPKVPQLKLNSPTNTTTGFHDLLVAGL